MSPYWFPVPLLVPQMQWLVAINYHIASSLLIEQDDFEYAPFNQFGGIGLRRTPRSCRFCIAA